MNYTKQDCERELLYFEQILRRKPEDHELWFFMGSVLGRLNRVDEALSAFNRATELKPDYFDAWYTKGFLYVGLGLKQKAIDACYRAQEIKPDLTLIKSVEKLL